MEDVLKGVTEGEGGWNGSGVAKSVSFQYEDNPINKAEK